MLGELLTLVDGSGPARPCCGVFSHQECAGKALRFPAPAIAGRLLERTSARPIRAKEFEPARAAAQMALWTPAS